MGLMSDVKNAKGGPGVEPVWDQKPPAWDEVRPRGTSGGLGGISGADWLLYGAVAAVALGIGLVNALSKAQDVAWRGGVYDARTQLFWELSSVVTIILVAPVLFVAVRRMRHVRGWPLRIALAVAAILAFSSLHIAGMVGLRKLAMLLVGSAYDFHFSAATRSGCATVQRASASNPARFSGSARPEIMSNTALATASITSSAAPSPPRKRG